MKRILPILFLLTLATDVFPADSGSSKKTSESKAATPSPETPAKKAPKVPSPDLEELANSLTAEQKKQLLEIVNKGDSEALGSLPGVAAVRAKAIQAARPFNSPIDLYQVPGIGEATLKQILNHAKADFPTEEEKPKAPAKKKSAE